jgi:putative redox protein
VSSAGKTVEVRLRRLRGGLFEATNAGGQKALIEGSAELGGGMGEGVRPMEALLMALAGCSALDVIHILEKQQKEPLGDLDVSVRGLRADAVPAVYTDIAVDFEASGSVNPAKLERAVKLSMEKYCSVAKMLQPTATITYTVKLREG